MKKILLFSFLFFFLFGFSQQNEKPNKSVSKVKPDKATKALRKKHAKNLASSPFKEVTKLTKKERKALGIPPNKYYESEWELTMNPEIGRPNPENLEGIKKNLKQQREAALLSGRTPGDGSDNNWIERGPNNVGGRVRAIMFDPNDPTYKTVFAGGVSGGLWKNSDITANTLWTRVNIPDNLSISTITYDPNNTNVFYVGTGESYVAGDVNGSGVWKSADGGLTWSKVFGGISGATTFQSAASLTINSPAGIAGNYSCYPTTAFGTAVSTPITENVVLVIDEINRGNSSAIFGSVFQLLDRNDDGWSSYDTSINGVAFLRLLELIGFGFGYDGNGNVDEYKLKGFENAKKLETFQPKLAYLNFDLVNKTIKIPPNLHIIATMNTSDNSIYHMDTAFKRRWEWQFIDVNSTLIREQGVAFKGEDEWVGFIGKLNQFIKSNHNYIRGIEDKQIGKYFIKGNSQNEIEYSIIQSKLMFFIWDSVFNRDKKPLYELLDMDKNELVTFGDFALKVKEFVKAVQGL